jgi:hypothetical protein
MMAALRLSTLLAYLSAAYLPAHPKKPLSLPFPRLLKLLHGFFH